MHPNQYINEVMHSIELSHKNGHLLYPDEYLEQMSMSVSIEERNEIFCGFSNHPGFEKLPAINFSLKLKANVSASTAIQQLLTEYQTVVSCDFISVLTYYLCILKAMQSIHGELNGAKRFDLIYGSSEVKTPEWRLLYISAKGPLATQYPLQPLSYVFETQIVNSKQELLAKAQLGNTILFVGDPYYSNIHPRGCDAGNVCIVTTTKPLKVRTFGVGNGEVTEKDLIQNHTQSYQSRPSIDSLAITKGKSFELQAQRPIPTIRGFENVIISWREAELSNLLSLSIAEIESRLEIFKLQHIALTIPKDDRSKTLPSTLVEESLDTLSMDQLFKLLSSISSQMAEASPSSPVEAVSTTPTLLPTMKPTVGRDFRKAASENDLAAMKSIYSASKVNINEKGHPSGRTALHQAAARGHADAVQWLLSKNAMVSEVDREGKTPLELASNPKVIELLSAKVAERRKSTKSGLHTGWFDQMAQ